jgi:hypothetical protein
MSFQVILDATLLPNVLVDIICCYESWRPVAYQFCRCYLKRKLGSEILKMLNIDDIVGQMLTNFAEEMNWMRYCTSGLTIVEASKYYKTVSGGYHFIYDNLVTVYCHSSSGETLQFFLPSLLMAAKGGSWVENE